MRTVLHILTAPPDRLTAKILQHQESEASGAGYCVERVDLTQTSTPDYDALLDQIFRADSVSTW